jgi:hypothetical protein
MRNVDWQAARQSPPTELDTTISTSCNLSITAPQVGQYISLLQRYVKHRLHHHSGAHQHRVLFLFLRRLEVQNNQKLDFAPVFAVHAGSDGVLYRSTPVSPGSQSVKQDGIVLFTSLPPCLSQSCRSPVATRENNWCRRGRRVPISNSRGFQAYERINFPDSLCPHII